MTLRTIGWVGLSWVLAAAIGCAEAEDDLAELCDTTELDNTAQRFSDVVNSKEFTDEWSTAVAIDGDPCGGTEGVVGH
jgi:hypothetical protein